jgi:predicted methyltransferase
VSVRNGGFNKAVRPMRNSSLLLAVALLAVVPAASAAAAPLPANITAAAADPDRAVQAPEDAVRHGPEILAFSGVKPGAKVLDLIPGGGYWTRLFANAVGPKGHVYGVWPDAYAVHAHSTVLEYQTLAGSKAFPNVSAELQPAAKLTTPEKLDLVFTAQNYHDYPDKFMGAIAPATFNAEVFAALKPGGVFLIIDHAAAAGSGMRDTDTLHRIDPAIVKAQVTAAGFRFVGESRVLANPGDDHAKAVFDKTIRGRTDQFIYKFRKPA